MKMIISFQVLVLYLMVLQELEALTSSKYVKVNAEQSAVVRSYIQEYFGTTWISCSTACDEEETCFMFTFDDSTLACEVFTDRLIVIVPTQPDDHYEYYDVGGTTEDSTDGMFRMTGSNSDYALVSNPGIPAYPTAGNIPDNTVDEEVVSFLNSSKSIYRKDSVKFTVIYDMTWEGYVRGCQILGGLPYYPIEAAEALELEAKYKWAPQGVIVGIRRFDFEVYTTFQGPTMTLQTVPYWDSNTKSVSPPDWDCVMIVSNLAYLLPCMSLSTPYGLCAII